MKKVIKIMLSYICICLFCLVIFSFSNLEIKSKRIGLNLILKKLDSSELISLNEDTKEEFIEEESVEDYSSLEEVILDEEEIRKEDNLSNDGLLDVSIYPVLETVVGSMSGYGPDCYGCTSNKTASGYYVGEGNIYYTDQTFGNVRILSADKKYPFGTIVRISGLDEVILAIVLDTGSAIGLDKRIQFDLLFTKESEASVFGLKKDLTFEILRYGY